MKKKLYTQKEVNKIIDTEQRDWYKHGFIDGKNSIRNLLLDALGIKTKSDIFKYESDLDIKVPKDNR
jgi:hypothetical protein